MVKIAREDMPIVGITALVPPEIVYASGNVAVDMNNFVPVSTTAPRDKLCAWTAIWRELTLIGRINIDKLVVVAGGDCNNAIVDGEKLELSGIKTHYFMYPFDGSHQSMKEEVLKLLEFLGGDCDEGVYDEVGDLKKQALEIDALRVDGLVGSREGYMTSISGSDLSGGLSSFKQKLDQIAEVERDYEYRVALIGTPPIYSDFHGFLEELGLHVVYDEMPYEFLRLGGNSIDAISKNYSEYTFARNILHRTDFIKKELKKRDVDGVIHFHQFACHHKLEDPILRKVLCPEGYSYIAIEADLPSKTPEQTRLRLEAFKEMLGEFS